MPITLSVPDTSVSQQLELIRLRPDFQRPTRPPSTLLTYGFGEEEYLTGDINNDSH